ncbi:MAG: hypothetical protein ABI833_15615 [Acidobacteriota bacterium]
MPFAKLWRAPAGVLGLLTILLFVPHATAFGQEEASPANQLALADSSTPDSSGASNASGESAPVTTKNESVPLRQPKRILGVMPNFRAVSAGTIPPPPTMKQSFKIATQNSFDYSSYLFVGVTSALALSGDKHPQLGEGLAGFGRYYWRGFADKTVGNYMVIFALPTIFHQDERYYALGKGNVWKRLGYAVSRVAITPNYQGRNSFNASELLGRGIAQGISLSYYPSQSRTGGEIATKYAYAIMRDALTNAFREVWPDIAVHALHRHP